MRHIVAGPLRGLLFFGPASRAGCCTVNTLLHKYHARCAGSRFALRAQVVRRCAAPGSRCCARSPGSPLRGSPSLHRASLLRRPPPLRGSSPGIHIHYQYSNTCQVSTSVLASLYPCPDSTSVLGRPHPHLHP